MDILSLLTDGPELVDIMGDCFMSEHPMPPPPTPLPLKMPFGLSSTSVDFQADYSSHKFLRMYQLYVSMSGLGVLLSHARLHCTFIFAFVKPRVNCFNRGRCCIKHFSHPLFVIYPSRSMQETTHKLQNVFFYLT